MKKRNYMFLLALAVVLFSCVTGERDEQSRDFVYVKDGQFIRQGKPYYYIGTNFWYGAILGSEGQGGDRKRLCQEL